MLRRVLAAVLMQAAVLALPGVPCVALAASPARAKAKCTVSACASKRTTVRADDARCCDVRPLETAASPRRPDEGVAAPAVARALPHSDSYLPASAPAGRTAAPAFRAPLVLRL